MISDPWVLRTHEPKTVVFEFGLVNDSSFRRFLQTLVRELTAAGIHSTSHWSKNAGLTPERLLGGRGNEGRHGARNDAMGNSHPR
jgi:hypothetical protein